MRQKNSKKRYILVISLAIVFALILSGCTPSENANSNTNEENVNTNAEAENADFNVNVNTATEETVPTPSEEATPKQSPTPQESQDQVKTFEVIGKNFSYSLTEIKVKKGDKVKIVFKNEEGFHNWVIDEFNAKTPQIQEGKTAEVEFIADKTGIFEYYCSVGEHRAKGMKGNLIVE